MGSIEPAADSTVVRLVVYKIEADLIETTKMGDRHPNHLLGYITAYAIGGGRVHSWRVEQSDRVCIGDTVEIDMAPPRRGDAT